MRGDDPPAGLDLVAFDGAVNSGPSRGVKWLQHAVGVTADGVVGPATLMAAQSTYAPAAIERAIAVRLAFLRSLKTWGTFGKGWQRRLDGVKAKALEMAGDGSPPVRPDAPIAPPAAKPKPAPVGGIVAALVALGAAVAAWFGLK